MDEMARKGRGPFSVARFLAALILLYITRPLLEETQYGDVIDVVLSSLVMLSAVLAVGGRRRTLAIATILVVPSLFGTWWKHIHPHSLPRTFPEGITIVFVGFIVVNLFNFIIKAPRVTSEVLCAGIANYLMLGLFWSLVDQLLARLVPGSFEMTMAPDRKRELAGFLAMYYSFGTMTTCAFGDVVPVSNIARMLSMLQAMTGVFYMAIIIARLVALYSTEKIELEQTQKQTISPDSSVAP